MFPAFAFLLAAQVVHAGQGAPRFPHPHRPRFFCCGYQQPYLSGGENSVPDWWPREADDRPVVIEARPPLYQRCDPMGPIDADANQDCR
jgi:hypothetical protein